MSKRSQQGIRVNLTTVYWIAWGFGTLLIVLSWLRVVSPIVGWIGFAITGAATLMSIVVNRHASQSTRSAHTDTARPVEVSFTEALMQLKLVDGRVISAPLDWYPKLREATAEQRAHYTFDANGVYWPVLKVDVSVLDLLDGVPPDAP